MSDKKKSVVARNFLKNLSRGVMKSIPVGGALLEQVIYGTLDGEAAQKEAEKLHSALGQIGKRLEGQDVRFGDILDELEKDAAFRKEFGAELGKISALLKHPEKGPISDKLEKAIASGRVRRAQAPVPQAFISHSAKDKAFVRRLSQDLDREGVTVWLDERQLRVGDSLVERISEGLKDSGYFIIVLSKASVESNWVKAELNASLIEELSDKGTVILPALIEDCDVPVLLRDRKYADFRSDYDSALREIIDVLTQETNDIASAVPLGRVSREQVVSEFSDCLRELSKLKMAELRRRMSRRLDRTEVSGMWFDTLDENMEDDMSRRTLNECVIELISRARNRGKMAQLLDSICELRPDLANPR